jgi:hypothetical protein
LKKSNDACGLTFLPIAVKKAKTEAQRSTESPESQAQKVAEGDRRPP